MTSASMKRLTALTMASIVSLTLAGCGGGVVEDVPANAPYVAPPPPPTMAPAPKQKKQSTGVPLGLIPINSATAMPV